MDSREGGPGRRAVLAGGGLVLLGACTGDDPAAPSPSPSPPAMATPTSGPLPSAQALPAGVFALGVASGDPLPDGVVIWTRLAPDPTHGGGLGARSVDVEWQVATDAGFRQVVASGTATALPAQGHSLHVEVSGLRPATSYAYRFRAGRQVSPTGRTRTAPAVDAAPTRVRFAVASCQDLAAGWFTSQRALAEEELDVVVFLGDYVYEGASSPLTLRLHEGVGEPTSLVDYRNRYGQYRSDPALQAAHAAHPWLASMDDHEIDNDWAGPVPQDGQGRAAFAARRAAALQAWWEHMPLRAASRPRGVNASLYRRFSYGDLVQLDVLDSRQHRRRPGTVLGAAQERWLADGLRASRAQWNVVASQVMVARQGGAVDDWDAFPDARRRLLRSLAPARNPVVVSGDRHQTWACDLVERFGDPDAEVLGAEVTGTSLTSGGDQPRQPFRRDAAAGAEPHHRYWDNRRGYLVCDADRRRLQVTLRTVSTVQRQAATTSTGAVLVVEDRVRGVQVERSS